MKKLFLIPLLAGSLLTGCTASNQISTLTPAGVMVANGKGVIQLRPQVAAGSYITQAQVSPNTPASVDHLALSIFTVDGSSVEHQVVDTNSNPVTKTVTQAHLSEIVTFSSLRMNTHYRVKAVAYNASSQAISATVSLDINVGMDEQPTVQTMAINLLDKTFSGTATSSFSFASGSLINSGTATLSMLLNPFSLFAGGISGNLDGTGTAAKFSYPNDLCTDTLGNVYVSDFGNRNIRKITPSAVVTTIATGINAKGVAVDGSGNVYVSSDAPLAIYKIQTNGASSSIATPLENPYDVAADGNGNVFFIDGNTVKKISSGTVSTFVTGLNTPFGLAVSPANNLFVSEIGANRITKVAPNGASESLPVTTNSVRYIAVDADENVFYANMGNKILFKISGGTATTLYTAPAGTHSFGLWGITVDSNGNLFVADRLAVYTMGY